MGNLLTKVSPLCCCRSQKVKKGLRTQSGKDTDDYAYYIAFNDECQVEIYSQPETIKETVLDPEPAIKNVFQGVDKDVSGDLNTTLNVKQYIQTVVHDAAYELEIDTFINGIFATVTEDLLRKEHQIKPYIQTIVQQAVFEQEIEVYLSGIFATVVQDAVLDHEIEVYLNGIFSTIVQDAPLEHEIDDYLNGIFSTGTGDFLNKEHQITPYIETIVQEAMFNREVELYIGDIFANEVADLERALSAKSIVQTITLKAALDYHVDAFLSGIFEEVTATYLSFLVLLKPSPPPTSPLTTPQVPLPAPSPEPLRAPPPVSLPASSPEPLLAPPPVGVPTPPPESLPDPPPVRLSAPSPEQQLEAPPVAIQAPSPNQLPDPKPVVLPAPEPLPDPPPVPVLALPPVALLAPPPEALPDPPTKQLPDPSPAALPAPPLEPLPAPAPLALPDPKPVALPASEPLPDPLPVPVLAPPPVALLASHPDPLPTPPLVVLPALTPELLSAPTPAPPPEPLMAPSSTLSLVPLRRAQLSAPQQSALPAPLAAPLPLPPHSLPSLSSGTTLLQSKLLPPPPLPLPIVDIPWDDRNPLKIWVERAQDLLDKSEPIPFPPPIAFPSVPIEMKPTPGLSLQQRPTQPDDCMDFSRDSNRKVQPRDQESKVGYCESTVHGGRSFITYKLHQNHCASRESLRQQNSGNRCRQVDATTGSTCNTRTNPVRRSSDQSYLRRGYRGPVHRR